MVTFITIFATTARGMTKRANSHIVSPMCAPQSGPSLPSQPGHRGTKLRQLPRTGGPPCPLAPHRGADLACGGGDLWRVAGAHLVPSCAALVAGPTARRLVGRLARQPAARDHPRSPDAPASDQHRARHGASRALAALSALPQPSSQPPRHAAPHRPAGGHRELLRGAHALAPAGGGRAATAPRPLHAGRPTAARTRAHDARFLAGGRRPACPRRAGVCAHLGGARGADGACAGLGALDLRHPALGLCDALRLSGHRADPAALLHRASARGGPGRAHGDRGSRGR